MFALWVGASSLAVRLAPEHALSGLWPSAPWSGRERYCIAATRDTSSARATTAYLGPPSRGVPTAGMLCPMSGATTPPPWRVFLSCTSELERLPQEWPYVEAAKAAVEAAGSVLIMWRKFRAADREPANICIDHVQTADVYV
jgi:hypothetical protein